MEVIEHPQDPTTGRYLIAVHVSSVTELGQLPATPSKHFVLFVAADGDPLPRHALVAAARSAVDSGAVYVCAWGSACHEVELAFDLVAVERDQTIADAGVIMTTCHERETLESALWFALNTAWPDETYEATCNTLVAVAVANSDRFKLINAGLSSPRDLWLAVQAQD